MTNGIGKLGEKILLPVKKSLAGTMSVRVTVSLCTDTQADVIEKKTQ